MTSDLRFVLDTNTLVSAFLFKKSVVRQAYNRAQAIGRLLVSGETAQELNDVLERPKFDKYLRREVRIAFAITVIRKAHLVEIQELITESRDAKDNKFLELAVSGNAASIVSGDEDLLVLNPFRGIPILTPRQFLEREFQEE
jgi:uncharacterized protein